MSNSHNQLLNLSLSDRLGTVKEYYFSKKLREIDQMRASGKQIISLGIGSPDLPPHPDVMATLHSESLQPTAHGYQSYKGDVVLRKAFARWYACRYGVTLDPESEILPLIGSKEGLVHICMTYLNKGDKVLVPNPGYPTYRSAVALAQGECVEYHLSQQNDYQPDFESISRSMEGVKMMIVNYPHMPTGALPSATLFEKLVAFAKQHAILLVHDNPYSFIRNEQPQSLLAVAGAMDVAIELNSLSKSHNMPGWRIGALIGDSRRIDEVLRFKSNMDSGMFLPMQRAAATALSLGDEWYKVLNETYYRREALGYQIMQILGCSARKDQAGLFLWGELPKEYQGDCYAFADDVLYGKGVFITPGGIFGSAGDRYIRISLCANEQTLKNVVDILKQ